jgi:hypothetical protein
MRDWPGAVTPMLVAHRSLLETIHFGVFRKILNYVLFIPNESLPNENHVNIL